MQAEYFPPREDVILQNEASTDLYLLVTGAVVRKSLIVSIKISWCSCKIVQGYKKYIYLFADMGSSQDLRSNIGGNERVC